VLNQSKLFVDNNRIYLNSIENNPEIRQIVEQDPRLQWYWMGTRLIDSIFNFIDK